MIQNKEIRFEHLGLKAFKEAWDYQKHLFKKIVDIKIANRKIHKDKQIPTPNYLLFVYHPHVYTLGKSGKEAHLLLNDKTLREKKAVYYKINRGGDITYHGPGQIVGYPILDLDNFFTDIHKYLRSLEEVIIRTLAEYNLMAGRIDGLTGVWLDSKDSKKARKICSLGIKLSRWVTMHGFAFNVNVDLNYFNDIIPCGINDKTVTSLYNELGQPLVLAKVEEKLIKHFKEIFGVEWI